MNSHLCFRPMVICQPADVSKVYRTYRLDVPLATLLERLLSDYALSIPYEDLQRDIGNIREAILGNLALRFDLNEDERGIPDP